MSRRTWASSNPPWAAASSASADAVDRALHRHDRVSPVPEANLLDVRGEAVSLAAARAGAPAVVVFYRGAWCPYCNLK